MKKHFLIISFLLINFFSYSQQWDYFKDKTEYTKFTENIYKTTTESKIYDKKGNVIDVIPQNKTFSSSGFAYVQDRRQQPFDTFEYMVSYEEGWISTDDIVLVNSETLPISLLTTNKQRSEKIWIPTWYNNIVNENKQLAEYSDYYQRYKNSLEYSLTNIHSINLNNTLIVLEDTVGFYYFLINKIQKQENVYVINCEIDKSIQTYFNNFFENETFSNFPDMTLNRNTNLLWNKMVIEYVCIMVKQNSLLWNSCR